MTPVSDEPNQNSKLYNSRPFYECRIVTTEKISLLVARTNEHPHTQAVRVTHSCAITLQRTFKSRRCRRAKSA